MCKSNRAVRSVWSCQRELEQSLKVKDRFRLMPSPVSDLVQLECHLLASWVASTPYRNRFHDLTRFQELSKKSVYLQVRQDNVHLQAFLHESPAVYADLRPSTPHTSSSFSQQLERIFSALSNPRRSQHRPRETPIPSSVDRSEIWPRNSVSSLRCRARLESQW